MQGRAWLLRAATQSSASCTPRLLRRSIQLQVFLGIRSFQLRGASSRRRRLLPGRPQLRLGALQLGPHLAQRLVMLPCRLLQRS